MAAPAMAVIEAYGIPAQKLPHDACHRNQPSAHQQMEVVGDKRPCIAGRSGLLQNAAKSFHKTVSVKIIFKYRPLFDASTDDMMQRPRSVYARFSWHNSIYSMLKNKMHNCTGVPFISWNTAFPISCG
jgi:hypothetical protein